MKRIAAAGAAALVLLAGCGQTNYAEDGFKSLDDFYRVAEKAGWSCVEPARGDEAGTMADLGDHGWSGTPCSNGSIAIYESRAKQMAGRQPGNFQPLKAGECYLDGRNWTARGMQFMVEDLEKSIGGEITCA